MEDEISGEAQEVSAGHISVSQLCPRVTSAIVASNMESTKFIMTDIDPVVYVLDKALNYGNSGGPIIASDTGSVHAVCSRFQPMFMPQSHIHHTNGEPFGVMIPSLYGIASSLANNSIVDFMKNAGISFTL